MEDIELKNCPEQTLSCAGCSKANMKVWIIAPTAPVTHVINFTCAFCKMTSEKLTFNGLIKTGVIARDDSRFATTFEDIVDHGDYSTFVMKAQK